MFRYIVKNRCQDDIGTSDFIILLQTIYRDIAMIFSTGITPDSPMSASHRTALEIASSSFMESAYARCIADNIALRLLVRSIVIHDACASQCARAIFPSPILRFSRCHRCWRPKSFTGDVLNVFIVGKYT